jgi:hypothetical protein
MNFVTTQATAPAHADRMACEGTRHPEVQEALRRAKLLIGGFLAVSVLALAAIALLRNHPALVTGAVWTRGIIVTADGLLMLACAAYAARGSRRSYLRLRLLSAVTIVAIVVIDALPGTFPVWMKIEQAVCGIVMIGVVLTVNARGVRSAFARR